MVRIEFYILSQNKMYEERVGKRVRIKPFDEVFFDEIEHNLKFNEDMLRAIKKNPTVDILKTIQIESFDGEYTYWRLKARFSDWQVRCVLPTRFEWVENSRCLFL